MHTQQKSAEWEAVFVMKHTKRTATIVACRPNAACRFDIAVTQCCIILKQVIIQANKNWLKLKWNG